MQECPRQPARPQEALRWLCSGGAALVGAGDKALLELTLFQNKVLDVDGTKVKLQIWDTAGQERFRSVTHAYYRDAHALLLLYDVTSRASFDNTKVDSSQGRAVKREDGEKLAREYGLPFMETSAKTGLNVDLAFTAIAKSVPEKFPRPGPGPFPLLPPHWAQDPFITPGPTGN
ncbi:PREDICTED: ras-related protein Rab-26 isoform X9 [Condylura cristata]|uniref:ras-related protein Rab-26 isoform X9 n=1 Tax=Condylura cristata TaxID=143302 RepID=UPI000643E7F5|nr:PREDICTED: ras-related protein Rab-26 isoform X9 [Condylura cristata]